MNFLYPAFLFGLFAIAIPVIVHLFNFRKFRKIYFTNVKFLREVKEETRSKSRLKHLLVLCCRILAIIFLVLAFAQPFIPSENTNAVTGDKVISVFVDNSFSMQAKSSDGALFEEALEKAREIADAFKPSDKFQLLTNDFEGRHQRLVNREEFLNLLDEMEISASVKKFSEVVSRQQDLLLKQEDKHKFAFLVSDFQKSVADFQSLENDTSVRVKLIPVSTEQANNLYIDSIWFSSPVRRAGQVEEMKVRIKNASDISYENTPVKLIINGQQKAPASFDIGPNATEEITLTFTVSQAGLNQGVVKITDYPVTYDDDFYFSFNVDENLPVLIINGEKESPYLTNLYGSDDYFDLQQTGEKNIDFSQFPRNRLIILNELKNISSGLSQELNRFNENGGSIFIIPSSDMDIESYKSFLLHSGSNYYAKLDTTNLKVTRIDTDHLIFKNVFESVPENLDLPVSNSHYSLVKSSRSGEEALLKLQNGNVFLARYPAGSGFIYLSAVPFNRDFSNFQKHALFVPVLYNVALNSQPQQALFYTTGIDEIVENPRPEVRTEIIKISDGSNYEIIPEQKTLGGKQQLIVHDQVKTAGNFRITSGEETFGGISFNFDRSESELDYFSQDEIAEILEKKGLSNFSLLNTSNRDVGKAIEELNLGRRLWKLCIIFVLIFLLTEIALLRFYKT